MNGSMRKPNPEPIGPATGALFGIIGLMLADPMVAMIKVALERQSRRNVPVAAAD